jgi:hypothetical protein
MCFWFGLEILRLVYKKAFFEILKQFLSYLTFYPPKKVGPPLIRVLKNFFKIGHTGNQKKRNFALISKMCRSLVFGKGEKIFYIKTEFFQKIVFLRKNVWELLDARVVKIVEISAKFHFF